MKFRPIYKYFVHNKNDEIYESDSEDVSGASTKPCITSATGTKYCTSSNLSKSNNLFQYRIKRRKSKNNFT